MVHQGAFASWSPEELIVCLQNTVLGKYSDSAEKYLLFFSWQVNDTIQILILPYPV